MPAVTAAGHLAPRPPGPLRIVVTVGTDHHPFDRLISWTNDWLDAHPEQAPGFFVQSGTAAVVPACAGERFLEVERLDAALGSADVIVSHGGPATIAAAWARGLLPIVVPRVPHLGEHVDDHQVSFAVRLAELGRVRLAQTPGEFTSVLAEATSDHARLRASLPATDVGAAVARFGELVEDLVSRSRRRLPWRARQAIRTPPTVTDPQGGPTPRGARRTQAPANSQKRGSDEA
jgi:UDP-N-acetylglucosamine transferase subunit ALG13